MAEMQRRSILKEAQRIVHGDRSDDYGHPLYDFARTAGMASAMLVDKLRPGVVLEPTDIGMLMILVKLSRQVNRAKRDNLVDIAGYAETLQMCADECAQVQALCE